VIAASSEWLHRAGLAVAAVILMFSTLSAVLASEKSVYVLEIDGAIGPAGRDYVVRGIDAAEAAGAELVVLRVDTPGGLDASMRDIIKRILSAEVPVATWVGPPGARAASAGTYILYASHIAAMAPSTNLGAATPVQIGGGGNDDRTERSRTPSDDRNDDDPEESQPAAAGSATERKAVEDAVAYIRGLAERHGRNADWAERAVRESVSLTSSEALAENVIDLVADDVGDLLEQVHGRELELGGMTIRLETRDADIQRMEPDWRNKLLSVITNPTLAYLLLMVGIYGLILEGYNPGALVPGVIGGICLLLALYAFQVLPVNYAGLALIILGLALIAVELFVPSFGILGIGGVVAVSFGSVILLDSDVPGLSINTGVIAGLGVISAGVFFVLIYLLSRSYRRPTVTGVETLIGRQAESLGGFEQGRGRVHVEGENWGARSDVPIARGEPARILAVDDLTLIVEPVSHSTSKERVDEY